MAIVTAENLTKHYGAGTNLTKALDGVSLTIAEGEFAAIAGASGRGSRHALLLADEPTGNLDSRTGHEVISLLLETSRTFHQTIVMITHNEEIARMADRVIRMEDGQITEGDAE